MPNMLKPGDTAPAFTLNNAQSKPVSLSDFAGHWVVLYFYPKDNTSGCTKEAKEFSALRSEFKKKRPWLSVSARTRKLPTPNL